MDVMHTGDPEEDNLEQDEDVDGADEIHQVVDRKEDEEKKAHVGDLHLCPLGQEEIAERDQRCHFYRSIDPDSGLGVPQIGIEKGEDRSANPRNDTKDQRREGSGQERSVQEGTDQERSVQEGLIE